MEQEKTPETAQRILEAALALWGEKGYSQSTMRELARRVGMGVSSLYFYFRSKEEIVQYLYRDLNQRARREFQRTDKGDNDLGANFRRFMQIKLQMLAPHRSSMAAVFREAIDPESSLSPMSSVSSPVLAENVEFFRGLVARTRQRGETAESLARLLWIGHIGVLFYWIHDRSAGAANTSKLIDTIAGSTFFLRFLRLLPRAGELMTLIDALFPKGQSVELTVDNAADESAAPARAVDVVVIGGGPIGAVYASFLKLQRPRTQILILERSSEPGHKIGESTLSGFCKALRSVGIRHEAMQTLFYPKNGLGFFHVDGQTDITRAPEYILESFDETFQVERRVLDSLVLANAERLGIRVLQGAKVDVDRLKLGGQGNEVVYSVGDRAYRLRASLIVDASGPAGTLSHKLGLRTSDGIPFQTSASWSYFSKIRPLGTYGGWGKRAAFPRDQYTQHFCFRQGWIWYIPIVSWQEAPTSNLRQAIGELLGSQRALPARQELIDGFGCPVRDIVSVGCVVRGDRDALMRDDPRAAFQHYTQKHVAVRKVLEGSKVLEDYYGEGQTFMSRLNFRSYSRQVAGDGWLLVGDAAFFVDPLISPGLTGGVAGAYHAARASARALEANVFSRDFLSDYESAIQRLHEALERDNQLVYMSFNHPEALALVQRFQEIDARRHFIENRAHDYTLEDTNVWGILDPAYEEVQKKAWAIMRDEELRVARNVSIDEQTPRDYEPMVQHLRKLFGAYLTRNEELTPYVAANR